MSREAMEMALDALCMPVARWNKIQTMKVDAAIKALRAELAKPEWLPIESAPEEGIVESLVFWNENGFDRIELDCIEDGTWLKHAESYEHFCMVASQMDGCSGPKEKPPYTHWQPLPPPPV